MTELATFGAGCFWHVEEAFREIKGVVKTAVGYMGGKMKNPTYEDVCTDETGHAEVVQLEFDPKVVPYEKLLDVFWTIHDPTQKNKQGPDVGTQYRSAIFYHSEEQKKKAEKSLKSRESADSRELENAKRSSSEEQKKHKEKIATEITKANTFYRAEEYHQKYLMKKGSKTCGI